MADELKTTTTSTFAQDEPEPSESDIIRARVNNYKVSLTPQAAQANITILEKSLRQGIFGLGDLDAVIALNGQMTEGLADYNITLENAQRALAGIAETETIEKQAELARREELNKVRLADERQLRKDAEQKILILETQLATLGQKSVAVVDDDGFVKVDTDNIVDAVEEPPITIAEPPKKSKAWDNVRLMRQPPVEEEVDEIVLDSEYGADEVQEKIEEASPIPPRVDQLILDSEFGVDEVQEKIEESFDLEEGLNGISEEDLIEAGFDSDGLKINEPESVSKQMMDDLEPIPEKKPTVSTGHKRNPFVTATNMPNMPTTEHDESDDLEAAKRVTESSSLLNGDSVTAELSTPDTVRTSLGKVKMIQDLPEEEEYDTITIPSASDLERLTKAQIKDEADKINFSVSKNQSKTKMISSFTSQTEKFIGDLKDSGDFVSASDVEDEEGDDDTTVRDGGFF